MAIIKENGGAGFLVVVLVTRVEDFDAHFLAWLGLARSDAIANGRINPEF